MFSFINQPAYHQPAYQRPCVRPRSHRSGYSDESGFFQVLNQLDHEIATRLQFERQEALQHAREEQRQEALRQREQQRQDAIRQREQQRQDAIRQREEQRQRVAQLYKPTVRKIETESSYQIQFFKQRGDFASYDLEYVDKSDGSIELQVKSSEEEYYKSYRFDSASIDADDIEWKYYSNENCLVINVPKVKAVFFTRVPVSFGQVTQNSERRAAEEKERAREERVRLGRELHEKHIRDKQERLLREVQEQKIREYELKQQQFREQQQKLQEERQAIYLKSQQERYDQVRSFVENIFGQIVGQEESEKPESSAESASESASESGKVNKASSPKSPKFTESAKVDKSSSPKISRSSSPKINKSSSPKISRSPSPQTPLISRPATPVSNEETVATPSVDFEEESVTAPFVDSEPTDDSNVPQQFTLAGAEYDEAEDNTPSDTESIASSFVDIEADSKSEKLSRHPSIEEVEDEEETRYKKQRMDQ